VNARTELRESPAREDVDVGRSSMTAGGTPGWVGWFRLAGPRDLPQVQNRLRVPSPLRPHTTMAIEKLNTAASEAQPRVISMGLQ